MAASTPQSATVVALTPNNSAFCPNSACVSIEQWMFNGWSLWRRWACFLRRVICVLTDNYPASSIMGHKKKYLRLAWRHCSIYVQSHSGLNTGQDKIWSFVQARADTLKKYICYETHLIWGLADTVPFHIHFLSTRYPTPCIQLQHFVKSITSQGESTWVDKFILGNRETQKALEMILWAPLSLHLPRLMRGTDCRLMGRQSSGRWDC